MNKFYLFDEQVKNLNLSEFEVECFIKVLMNGEKDKSEVKTLSPVIYRNGHMKECFRRLLETTKALEIENFDDYLEERFLTFANKCIHPTPLQIVYLVNGKFIVKQGVDADMVNFIWGIACNGLYYQCCLHMTDLALLKKRFLPKVPNARLATSTELKDLLPYLKAFKETVHDLWTFEVDVDDWLDDDEYRAFWIKAPEQARCWHPCALLFGKKVVQTSAHKESNQYIRIVVDAVN